MFRLLAKARDEQRPVPWVLLENVSGVLMSTRKHECGHMHYCLGLDHMGPCTCLCAGAGAGRKCGH